MDKNPQKVDFINLILIEFYVKIKIQKKERCTVKKRIMSAIVAVIMILSIVPAFAASADLQAFMDSVTAETITQHEIPMYVTKDLALPAAPDGITVTYSSSDPSAITNDGKVTRSDIEDKAVTFRVVATDGTDTLTKDISLNVVANATNVFYQNNFAYPELIGKQSVISDLGWVDQTSSKMEHSIRKDEDGNYYIYMDHAGSSYPQAGPSFTAQGSKITIQMDISVDFSAGSSKFIDLWLGMVGGSNVEYPKVRIQDYNGVAKVDGLVNLNTTGKTPLTIELDMENLTMRLKTTDDWKSKAIPSANEAWTGLKYILFRRGTGGSKAGVVEVDNLIVYEARDRASYADSLAVDKTMAVLDQAKMTDEDFGYITKNLNLNYAELAAANEANGTTVTFESSAPETIDGNGTVNRGLEEKDVTLTATVSKGAASSSKKYFFTVAASEAATEIQNAIAFSNMTNESNYAVTKDLNLSYNALFNIQSKYGAEVTFESSNPEVLEIKDGKGYISRGEEDEAVTLSVSAEVDGVTFSREYNIIVPANSTYVIVTDDFNYPEYKDEFVNGVTRWSTPEYTDRMHAKLREEKSDYFIEAGIDSESGGHHLFAYDHKQERETTALSVEMTLTYLETCTTPHYYFEAYCGKEKLARVSMTGTSVSLQDYANTAKFSGTRAKKGMSDRIKFIFDFENQCYDFYMNGTKLTTTPIAFKADADCDGLTRLEFSGYRKDVGAKYRIDDFVICAENAKFTQDYVSEAGQPLTISVYREDTNYWDSVKMYVTSDYDEEYDLRQVFKVNNVGSELIKNVIFDYHEAVLINKNSGATKALIGLPTADETAPPHFSTTYLGGNHGASHAMRVKVTGHGKTYNDIGSVWNDEAGVCWTLVRINSADELVFLSETEKDSTGNWKFAKEIGTTLTYDADYENNFAVNKGTITIESVTEKNMQLQPAIGNRVQKMYIYRDGETAYERIEVDKLDESFTINANKMVLDETYDIMDPSKIGYHLRANRPDGGYTSPADISIGTPIMHYHQTITVDEDGDVIIEHDHELLTDIRSFIYYGYQYYEKADAFGGGVHRYMPGIKGIESNGRFYDFSKPFDMTNDELPSSYTATKDLWANPDLAPDRTLEYYKDTDGNYKMAFAAGYVPILVAAPDVRKDNVTSVLTMYNRTGMKVYPMLVNASKFGKAGARVQAAVFRHYDNLAQSTKKVTAYDVEYKDDVYYYVDFLEDEDEFVLDLGDKTVTKDFELVYKTDDVEYEIVGNKLIVSGKQSGYICVKGKRYAEIATVAYDNATHKLGVWLNNRDTEAVQGDVVIAGYKEGQFKSISVKKNITLSANDFTRLDVEDFNDNGVDEIRVFLVNMGTLTPLNYVKVIEAE